jgi:N-acetyl sugar amidotransferase
VSEHIEAKYGLPREVRFCTRCVMSNQRPSSSVEFRHTKSHRHTVLHLDEEGVCDACRVAERKQRTDWKERELIDLLDQYRRNDGGYDVLVPGSGGKDSIYASHVLKYRYGMHPLTVTWAPHLYTDVGWKNFQNWLHVGGFDNYLFTPNGKVHRTLTKLAFENLLHPFQPFILGQKNFPPRVAAAQGIRLVMYGESEAEYGNPRGEISTAQRDLSYFASHKDALDELFLSGVPVTELNKYDIGLADLQPYFPAEQEMLKRSAIDVRYLGYYLKWVPQECYYYSVEHAGFQASSERTPGTYSKYNSLDDKIDDFHYYTTFIKFGLGRASYDAAQEIRNGHITREEGVALVRRFDGEFPQRYFSDFLNYISLSEQQFHAIVDSFRSPHLWESTPTGWALRYHVG